MVKMVVDISSSFEFADMFVRPTNLPEPPRLVEDWIGCVL